MYITFTLNMVLTLKILKIGSRLYAWNYIENMAL